MANIRDTPLVIAALVASMTYQAVLRPPSFISKVDNNSMKGFQGYYASWITGPLGRDFSYVVFMCGNTFGFLVSVQMIVCLTRYLPVRLPLLLSMTALVQTYYCFTFYLPFTLLDQAFGLKKVELLSVLPVTMSIILLLAQRQLALALDSCLKGLSQFNLVGDTYNLRTQSVLVNDRKTRDSPRNGVIQERGRSNWPPSRQILEEDQSDSKPVTNLKISESIGKVRNTLLVIATLIANTTYQAALQPPSFKIKVHDHTTQGFVAYYSSWVTHPLGRDVAYMGFIIGNTFGLLLSIQMIICLTKNLPVRLPLLLSVTALVQSYCCFTHYLPFTLRDKVSGLNNVELLSVLPIAMSILLLLAQRQLALAVDYWLEKHFVFNFLEDMYSLRAEFIVVNERENGEDHERERSDSPTSRPVSREDQSDGKPVTLTFSNKDKDSIGEMRNSLLVIAALIASATFQAVRQPPSFATKVDDNLAKGFFAWYASWLTNSLGRDAVYIGFISGNTFGLLLSIQTIICVTKDIPTRLPLLLSVTAPAQTYFCFTYYVPFTLLDNACGLKNVELLSVLPVTISILLLLAQRWLALALDYCLQKFSKFDLLGDIYSLRTQSDSHPSRQLSKEDQLEPVTNLEILTKEEESIGDIHNALLAVATLIVSATYQSMLQPPRFTIKVDNSSIKGFLAYYASWVTRCLGRDVVYVGFVSGNTFGLLLSIQMIICLTRDLLVKLPLLLSLTALVQTYYCFTFYLPFTLFDEAFGLKNVELLSVRPVTMSILLLLAQRQLALALEFWLEKLSQFNLVEDMYSLSPQLVVQARAKYENGRSNSRASRLHQEEERSDGKLVTNTPQLVSRSLGNIRNELLVVATLITSATYQVVLQHPSFTIKVGSSYSKGFLTSYASGMSGPLGRELVYIAFMSGNTFGLLVSIQMIICLIRDIPVRLPLLLSVTAIVQNYYCFTYYLQFKLLDKAFGLKNVELLSVLPLIVSILLLVIQ